MTAPDPHAELTRDEVVQTLAAPPPRRRSVLLAAAVVAVLLVGALVAGALPRWSRARSLAADLEVSRRPPPVRVVKPTPGEPTRSLSLPGTVLAGRETALYARTSGYLKRWLKDIGDPVKEGELLAEIDTPELDQELAQARATLAQQEAALAQSRASLELAQANFGRYEKLAPSGVASQQEVDERSAARRVAEANVQAARAAVDAVKANLSRLQEVKGFARVVAPFAGVVTARSTEVGALVTAGTASGAALFKVSQVDPLRVFVSVPQSFAPTLTWGARVPVRVREQPQRVFEGTVVRTAGALDEASRTLLTQIEVPNGDGALLAGTYVQVTLEAANLRTPFKVPSSAVLVSAQGARVATVVDGGVHFVPVQVELDLGAEVLLTGGLQGTEAVVANPGERLVEGLPVAIAEPRAAP
jgi:RND family efflux transporter MFP subunit